MIPLSEMPPKTRERPRTASVIAGNAFYGSDELTREHLEELRYPGVQGAVEGLIKTWNGGLIGMVAVELSPDNSRVKDAHFVLAGTVFGAPQKVYTSGRFFEGTPLKMVIKDFNAQIFTFRNSLVSDLVDSAGISFEFRETADSPALTREQEVEKGINGFALRAFIHPTSVLMAKIIISLYPLPIGNLKETYTLADHLAFPGLNFFSAAFQLAPSQTDVFTALSWGQPLLPAVLSDLCLDETVEFPSTSDFRAAVGNLLRSTSLPDHKGNPKALKDAWTRTLKEGEACLKAPFLSLVWPKPRAPMSVQEGRNQLLTFLPFSALISFQCSPLFIFYKPFSPPPHFSPHLTARICPR